MSFFRAVVIKLWIGLIKTKVQVNEMFFKVYPKIHHLFSIFPGSSSHDTHIHIDLSNQSQQQKLPLRPKRVTKAKKTTKINSTKMHSLKRGGNLYTSKNFLRQVRTTFSTSGPLIAWIWKVSMGVHGVRFLTLTVIKNSRHSTKRKFTFSIDSTSYL